MDKIAKNGENIVKNINIIKIIKYIINNINDNTIKINHLFLLTTVIYILFSDISVYSSVLALFSAIFFYVSFIVGERLYYLLNLEEVIDNIIISKNKNYNGNNILKLISSYSLHYKLGIILLFIGILFIFLDILWVRDIPLFNPLSRRFLNVQYTALSHMLIVGWAIVISSKNLSKLKIGLYTLVFSALIMLIGYRTNVMVVLLSVIFVMYYSKKINTREVVISAVGIFGILLLMSVIRLLMLSSSGNPILSRIDLTMSVYDVIVKNFNGVFNGYLHYCAIYSYLGAAPGPRGVIAKIIGVSGVSITPTIFGAVIADYGTLGLVPYFGILGIFFGLFYKISKKLGGIFLGLYSVISAYLLIGVETGILDLDVILYYLLGFILCLGIICLRIKEFLKRVFK